MTDTGKIAAAFRIEGRVQGVGFRWWTVQQAARLGITGTVRNVRDGSVEAFAIGTDTKLERFEELLREGPPAALVSRVTRSPAQPRAYSAFEIVD